MDVVEFPGVSLLGFVATRKLGNRAPFSPGIFDLASGALSGWSERNLRQMAGVGVAPNDALRDAVAQLEAFLCADVPQAR